MLNPSYSRLAVTGTVFLIVFLAYSSQLFLIREHLTRREFIIFNVSVGAIWIAYVRSIYTDPGSPLKGWTPWWINDIDETASGGVRSKLSSEMGWDERREEILRRRNEGKLWSTAPPKWCGKCEGWKPARAHHCKVCKKCVLLMDHHCPWIANCVGYRNWPHFLRFLIYVNISCSYLQYFLFLRCKDIWNMRDMPSYLGPSVPSLIHLTILIIFNSLTLLSLFVLLCRILANAFEGQTTIEAWEREKHASLVNRRVVRRQLFPFDVGFFSNLYVFFGDTFLLWLWPFTPTRKVDDGRKADGGGIRFEVNGFEDPRLSWPPHDPEKVNWSQRAKDGERVGSGPWTSGVDVTDVDAFRRRQREDMKRFQRIEELDDDYEERSGSEADPDGEWGGGYEDDDDVDEVERGNYKDDDDDKKWVDKDGNALADFGVDSDEEEEDNIPLSELLRRRKDAAAFQQQST